MSIRRMLLTVMLVGACVWCVGRVQRANSEEKAAGGDAGYKPVAPVEALMHAQEYHFKEIRNGLKEAAKEGKDPNFKQVQYHANVLAELCNVNHFQTDKEDYQRWAFEARDLSLELAAAAKEKKGDGFEDSIKKIYTVCTECHDKYQ